MSRRRLRAPQRHLIPLLARGFVPADVPQSEADALFALYDALGGDHWVNNTGWKTDPTVDNWHGITVEEGHVTRIDLRANELNGEWTAELLAPFTRLERLTAFNNRDPHLGYSFNCSFSISDLPDTFTWLNITTTDSTITGAVSEIPSGVTLFQVDNTFCEISGSLSDLPNNIQNFYVDRTPSDVTGTLSDLPASTLRLQAFESSCDITGGSTPMAATGIQRIRIQDTGMTQADVNSVIERIWEDRNLFTTATPDLRIGGDNYPPSGAVEDECPPDTPGQKIYNLLNAQCAGDTHNTWTILYTEAEVAARFGVFADSHYADRDAGPSIHYRDSEDKLTDAVADWNDDEDLDFVIELGDYTDSTDGEAQALTDLGVIEAVYDDLTVPRYYVLGNHCLDELSKAQFIENTGMTDAVYSFDLGGVHFVVLDPCFRSDDDDDDYDSGNFSSAVAYIPPGQRQWLDDDLDGTALPAVVFCHYRLDGEEDSIYVYNGDVVRQILEAAGNVLAVFCGHNHTNALAHIDDIAYYTMDAMCTYAHGTRTAYATVTIYDNDQIVVEGVGGQKGYP